jgi:hypothetical protein
MENGKRTEKRDLVEKARHLRLQVEALEKQVRLAKGTREIVGDDGPTAELMETVKKLITERPMTFQDLLRETGARDNRIKGVLMRLQREGAKVVNLGTNSKALWFLPDEKVLVRLRRATER